MSDQSVKSSIDRLITGGAKWKRFVLIVVIVLLALVLAMALCIRLFAGSGPKQVRSIPSNFPSAFVLYRPEDVRSIVYYPAAEKKKPLQFALLPLQWLSGSSEEATRLADSVKKGAGAIGGTDTVSLTWIDVDAPLEDILRFYAGSLKQAGIASPQIRQTSEKDITEIRGDADSFSADILVIGHPASSTIESITVIAEYPGSNK